MINSANTGEIITFYSFKGGTGRSMTLVNTAILVSRLAKKVLIIDWDLEAPGIHKFLGKYCIEDQKGLNNKGLIDLFIAFKADKSYLSNLNSNEKFERYLEKINFADFIVETIIEGVSFIKAGMFDNDYIENINTFNWNDIYNEIPYLFSMFTEYLRNHFDYVFIDSRTGYTDTSGICTMVMPDKLCLVFTTNSQSLEGVVNVSRKALNYRMNSVDFRPLKIFPIPSRVELAEKDLRELWRKGSDEDSIDGYQPAFERVFKDYYDLLSPDLTDYFNIVQIHHEPKYSYGEEIAVLNESFSDKLSLTTAYSELVQKLLSENNIFADFDDSVKPKLYISSTLESSDVLQELMIDLETSFIINSSIYLTDSSILEGIEESITNCDLFIPIISEKYLSNSFANYETQLILRSRLENDKQVILPVYYKYKENPHYRNIFNGFKSCAIDENLFNVNPSKSLEELLKLLKDFSKHFHKTTKDHIILNTRELEFLKLVSSELTYKQIADAMRISVRTVDGYRDQLFEKLKVKSRVGLVLYAIKNNIVSA